MENNINNEENSITLGKLLSILWQNIIIVAGVTILGVVITIVFVMTMLKPSYRSSATILVNPKAFQTSSSNNDISGGLRVTETVGDWIVETTNLRQTVEELESDPKYGVEKGTLSPSKLKSGISITQDITNLFVYVTYTSSDAKQSSIVLNKLIEVGNTNKDNYTVLTDAYDVVTWPISVNADGTETLLYSTVKPNKMLYAIVGAIGSFVVACAIVFIKETLRTKVKDQEDVEKLLGVNVLGIQYDISNPKSVNANVNNYERLLANIDFSVANGEKVIEITSSNEGEGKSTVVLNIAKTMAENNRKCLIVDLDLRASTVHKYFNIERGLGITDLVVGKTDTKSSINHYSDYIDIITSGTTVPNPHIILTSDKLKDTIESLKEKYDYIILDCPPMFISGDAKIISKFSDAQILTVRANQSKIKRYKEELKNFKEENTNIIGSVLTDVSMKNRAKSYYYYHYDNKDKEEAK